MKRTATLIVVTASMLAVHPALPQGMGQGMKDMPMESTANAHKGVGTVKKTDAARGTVTLAHEPVASLKWPAMTMEFEVADKRMLDSLKPGSRVQFQFKEKSGGKYVVIDVKP